MSTPDDEATTDALALIEASAEGRLGMAAAYLATLDTDDLRRQITRLLALLNMRTRVGADIESTAEWARWLRSRNLTV